MSRGPGVIQRKLLSVLASNPKTVFTVAQLAERAFPNGDGTPAEIESVRRALKKLPVAIWREKHMGPRGGRIAKYMYKPAKMPH